MTYLGWVIRYVHYDLREVAPKSLADQIQMFKVDPLGNLVVYLIDGGGTDARDPGEVGLRQAELTELS